MCAIWQADGEAAYAIYRVRSSWADSIPNSTLEVLEVIATSPLAHREIAGNAVGKPEADTLATHAVSGGVVGNVRHRGARCVLR